jgi:hypothetical protein
MQSNFKHDKEEAKKSTSMERGKRKAYLINKVKFNI